MKYSGIDLHSNNSVVTVTDETDRVVAEKRLPNDQAKIVGFLQPWLTNWRQSWWAVPYYSVNYPTNLSAGGSQPLTEYNR